MGAVALSQSDEDVILELQSTLKIPSKAQVVHRALEALQKTVLRDQLAKDISKSVKKCAVADQAEHLALTGAAFSRTYEL